MQTEPTAEPTTTETPQRGLLPKQAERLVELQAKATKKERHKEELPAREALELKKLEAVDGAEKSRQGLIHRLAEAADKFGRKEITVITRAVTDQVKVINTEETTEIGGLQRIYSKGEADMEREMRAAMQRIQESHNKAIKDLSDNFDKDSASVRAIYKGRYDDASALLKERTEGSSELVAHFISAVQGLEVEQLETLRKDGVLQIGEEFLVVPGVPQVPA